LFTSIASRWELRPSGWRNLLRLWNQIHSATKIHNAMRRLIFRGLGDKITGATAVSTRTYTEWAI